MIGWRGRRSSLRAVTVMLAALVAATVGAAFWHPSNENATGHEASQQGQISRVSLSDEDNVGAEALKTVERLMGEEAAQALDEGTTKALVPERLEQAAYDALSTYKARRDCVLVRAGFIDLLGNVWSCTVRGGDWVEIQVMTSLGDDVGTEVLTVRMDARTWQEELAETDWEGA